jgi:hypothetical protein
MHPSRRGSNALCAKSDEFDAEWGETEKSRGANAAEPK